MNTPREEWHLDTRRLSGRVLVFDCLDSTNTFAASLAHDSANGGIVVLADSQSAGRGQYGRSWTCAPGMGVLLSVLIFPPPELRRPVILAAWAAVAVCKTIEGLTGLKTNIKWPNDVLIGGRKVCGILIEQGRGTVVGIGLNVNQTPGMFAAAGLPQAASLANLINVKLDTGAVARVLIQVLDDEYDRLSGGDRVGLESDWKLRTGLLGRQVAVECHDVVRHGRLMELAWSALVLQATDGGTLRIPPESIRHVSLHPADSSDEPPA